MVDEQEEQEDSGVVVGLVNGSDREDDIEVGCEERRFCEYRHTGQLHIRENTLLYEYNQTYRLSPHLLRHIQ